jgi:hypothetical protein
VVFAGGQGGALAGWSCAHEDEFLRPWSVSLHVLPSMSCIHEAGSSIVSLVPNNKQRPRQLLACSSCNAIMCRVCLETRWKADQWVDDATDWVCHKCLGDCPCKSCKSRSAFSRPGVQAQPKRSGPPVYGHTGTEDEEEDRSGPFLAPRTLAKQRKVALPPPESVRVDVYSDEGSNNRSSLEHVLVFVEEERSSLLDEKTPSLRQEEAGASFVAPTPPTPPIVGTDGVFTAPNPGPVDPTLSTPATGLPRPARGDLKHSNSTCNMAEFLSTMASPEPTHISWKAGLF